MALTNQLPFAIPQSQTTSGYNPGTLPTATSQLQGNLDAFLNPNSPLMQQAAQRGREYANTRGGINSSIAAGASQRASLDTAQQLAQQATDIQREREAVSANDWASAQNFNRAMLGQFSSTAFNNSLNMLNTINQFALEDPELYTPEVVSGYSNFFQRNVNDLLKRYFGNGT